MYTTHTESSHIELQKVLKQAQVHCPTQMSYWNEIFVFKKVFHQNSAHYINNAKALADLEGVGLRGLQPPNPLSNFKNSRE